MVILKNEDYENRDELTEEFRAQIEVQQSDEKAEPWEKISAAIGFAIFDKDRDAGVDNVFRRADKLMYENKKEMKEVGK